MHDVQELVSRLVSKARRLIKNTTTNLAENWMQIRCKFDGGKVVNRIQSGSFQFRCSGAGLQKNLGKTWGVSMWEKMTGNSAFIDAANSSAKRAKLRKSTENPKNADEGISIPKKTTQLQLAKLIPDTMVLLNLMIMWTIFRQST